MVSDGGLDHVSAAVHLWPSFRSVYRFSVLFLIVWKV